MNIVLQSFYMSLCSVVVGIVGIVKVLTTLSRLRDKNSETKVVSRFRHENEFFTRSRASTCRQALIFLQLFGCKNL